MNKKTIIIVGAGFSGKTLHDILFNFPDATIIQGREEYQKLKEEISIIDEIPPVPTVEKLKLATVKETPSYIPDYRSPFESIQKHHKRYHNKRKR